MIDIGETTRSPKMARIHAFLARRSGVVRDYLTAVSGSVGRLVFSLVYFIALANTLTIADSDFLRRHPRRASCCRESWLSGSSPLSIGSQPSDRT
jgi:hypothetical protein